MQELKNKSKTRRPHSIVVNRRLATMLTLFAVLGISTVAFCQNAVPNWKLNASVKNVDFYYTISTCNGKSVVFLKFVNKNTKAVTIGFKEAFKTSAGTEEMASGGKKQLTLKPGETFAQNCSENTCLDCVVLLDRAVPTHKVEVQQFQFKEIEISTP